MALGWDTLVVTFRLYKAGHGFVHRRGVAFLLRQPHDGAVQGIDLKPLASLQIVVHGRIMSGRRRDETGIEVVEIVIGRFPVERDRLGVGREKNLADDRLHERPRVGPLGQLAVGAFQERAEGIEGAVVKDLLL